MPSAGTPFLEALKQRPLVFDGGMGTQLYERGYFITRSFARPSLPRPDLGQEIHRAYIAVGARVIETNTFGANRDLLTRYGAQDRLKAINRAGVRLAREAAGAAVPASGSTRSAGENTVAGPAYVAGAIGPTGRMSGLLSDDRHDELRTIFTEQIEALLEEGVDLLVLETFYSAAEVKAAIDAARGLYRGALVVQVSFSEERPTIDGLTPAALAIRLRDWGADVVGVNCSEGPAFIFEAARGMLGCGLPVSAQPNAGRPRRLDERTLYMTTPGNFGVYARRWFQSGVAIVGGCCGTSPEHIRRGGDAAPMVGGGRVRIEAVPAAGPAAEVRRLPPLPTSRKSALRAQPAPA